MIYKKGDIVQVFDEELNLKYTAIVNAYDDEGMYWGSPIDGTTFDHYLFKTTGQCIFIDDDIISNFFDDGLFTL